MEALELRLDKIEEALRRLEVLLETRLLPECERMGGHISFVEGVYEKLRRPLAALRGSPLEASPAAAAKGAESQKGPCIEEVD